MKIVLAILTTLTLMGCGTLGGVVSGAGEDMKRAGEWIKKI